MDLSTIKSVQELNSVVTDFSERIEIISRIVLIYIK